jgi:hypothetical protein
MVWYLILVCEYDVTVNDYQLMMLFFMFNVFNHLSSYLMLLIQLILLFIIKLHSHILFFKNSDCYNNSNQKTIMNSLSLSHIYCLFQLKFQPRMISKAQSLKIQPIEIFSLVEALPTKKESPLSLIIT